MKRKLFTLTAKDFKFEFYRGSGKGGQHRNKTDSACRCRHLPSGSVAKSEDQRKQLQNKRKAFERCCKTEKFQKWIKIESSRKLGILSNTEEIVKREMNNIKIEIKDKNGRWKIE
jgi:protein subunit release factor B